MKIMKITKLVMLFRANCQSVFLTLPPKNNKNNGPRLYVYMCPRLYVYMCENDIRLPPLGTFIGKIIFLSVRHARIRRGIPTEKSQVLWLPPQSV